MQLGMIGLGRMGANMVRRLIRGGHSCAVFDLSADNVRRLAGDGATGTTSMRSQVTTGVCQPIQGRATMRGS